MLYEKILKEKERLKSEISLIQTQLANFPEGKLICAKNGSNYKWYHSDGHQKLYIPKKERAFAEKLAIKKYLSEKLQDLTQEKKALDFYLRHRKPYQEKADFLLSNNSDYQELLSPYFKPLSQELAEWAKGPYEKNTAYSDGLIIKTLSGILVRSKSEAFICNSLYTNRIPHRYECALRLGETIIYPDFTIRHPATGKIYYWEHFGRMDDPKYSKNVFTKLQLYNSYNIIPSIQLITTYEASYHPLSSETAEKIIHEYFL